MGGWVATGIGLATLALAAVRAGCGASGPPREATITDSTPTTRPLRKPPAAVAESPESALRRRAREAYALYSERQFVTFHDRYTTPRYLRECAAGDRALLTNAAPTRRSIFGLEAMAVLDLRPSRVVVDGSEGMVFLELLLEERSLDSNDAPVQRERWTFLDGECYLDDLGARCGGMPSDP